MTNSAARNADWRTPTVVLVCGGVILTLAMGIRLKRWQTALGCGVAPLVPPNGCAGSSATLRR